MIKDFDVVKRQLSELSEVINKFKSEAVQLRIVEIVLASSSNQELQHKAEDDQPKETAKPRRAKPRGSKPKSNASKVDGAEKAPKKSRASGQGAVAALSDLVDNDFFENPKSIGDIVAHCEEKLARRFKSNEFSGKLARLTRDGVLDRNKNSDGQYEYVKT